jgi:Glycosyltransferase family 87
MGIKKLLYRILVMVNLIVVILVVMITVLYSFIIPVDFPVFYGAARNALHGLSIYTYFGLHPLPFWYFPWVSWIFIPLAIFSRQVAWIIYLVIGSGVAFLSVNSLANIYQRFSLYDRLFMFSMLLWMGWLVYLVGQISFLLLGAAVAVLLLIGKGRPVLAGLLFPLLLIKPHLFIVFLPLVLWLGGKKTFISAGLVTLFLIIIATLTTPHWFEQMLAMLQAGTIRVDVDPLFNFTTFPALLGFSQNFVGTADLPFTILLVVIAAFMVIRFRSMPKIPLLSLALAASLFCAPRSYAYDLVLLIPAMVWLSEKWSLKTALLWAACVIIQILSHFSSGSYLVTLLVFTLGILKAITIEKQDGISRSFFGMRIKAD